jgi:hypothetical protein
MFSALLSAVFAVVSMIGLPLIYDSLLNLPKWLSSIFALFAFVIFICTSGTVFYTFKGIGLPGPNETIQLILSLIAILLFLWAFPAFVIYWFFNPKNIKKAVQIGVFLTSSALAMGFYLSNKRVFKSPADIVSYFSGACLGPPAVIEILF